MEGIRDLKVGDTRTTDTLREAGVPEHVIAVVMELQLELSLSWRAARDESAVSNRLAAELDAARRERERYLRELGMLRAQLADRQRMAAV